MALGKPRSTAPSAPRKPQARLRVVSDEKLSGEASGPSSKPATASENPWTAFGDLTAYAKDIAERSVLFWDTLRRRADNRTTAKAVAR
ncbi:hypothetical protein AA309_27740, partial [Microvirga vignae]